MSVELKSYIVAFIDLLGFSSMVSHDSEAPKGTLKYIDALYESHAETKGLKNEFPDLQLIQFSDSVILALPYSVENYVTMIRIIADYQYGLLSKGILCRGGVSYGKHFYHDDFLFSKGMIDAYALESNVAISPRVVVGRELIDLVGVLSNYNGIDVPMILEQDGLWFIDYLCSRCAHHTWNSISAIVPSELSVSSSIRNKQIWLIDYYNHSFPDNIRVVHNKFKANV